MNGQPPPPNQPDGRYPYGPGPENHGSPDHPPPAASGPQDFYQLYPPPAYPDAPVAVRGAYTDFPSATSKPRTLPLVLITAAAAILLTIVVIAVVVVSNHRSSSSTADDTGPGPVGNGAMPQTTTDDSTTTDPAPTTDPNDPTNRPVVVPPLITAPDAYNQTCGAGYKLPDRTGWATHSGRASEATSCQFAANVLLAYARTYPQPSVQSRPVVAPGTVPCDPQYGPCRGNDFVMTCAVLGSDPWITCIGGNNARVYIY
ncbi:hypothetical protein [Williamsia sp. CHRR-6]|uniref:hypothetical protein n=1 Tax=Williamsia sp. CHRR-6 TaxID=2835871 RepID=UPI001BDB436C|nr:hypothetical protein [Williamsia sp. CHRR-6]MBT0565609.1 hypothetical protein [Williamsia sp. CHRR-6]